MKRLLAVVIAVALCTGCQSQGQTGVDPFFGHTRVPPPGTGSISDGTAPYYGAAPYASAPSAAPTTAPPYTPPMSSTGGQSGGNYAPPNGSFNYQGSSWAPPRGADSPTGRVESAATLLAERPRGASSEQTVAWSQREPVVQVLQPRSAPAQGSSEIRIPTAARASSPDEPQRLRATGDAVEITDLPPAGGVGVTARSPWASASGGARLATATAPISTGEAAGNSAATFAPRADYGFDPEYRWLRGRLDYSQIDRRWRLRYIPADGSTDRYGGSVVLPEEKLPAGCERGDFLEVRGVLGQKDVDKGYAPIYDVVEVKRLRQAAP